MIIMPFVDFASETLNSKRQIDSKNKRENAFYNFMRIKSVSYELDRDTFGAHFFLPPE